MLALPVHYSHGLVAISIFISVLAAYSAFSLADRMRFAATALHRRLWLLGGSSAMGMGIWSMHYLGMLALQVPVRIDYYVPTVVLSLLLAIAASAVALTVVGSDKLGLGQLVAGGVLMGAGIGGMHYVGMAAMRSVAMPQYSGPLVLLSILVAVCASILALWIGFAIQSREEQGEPLRITGGIVMGLGIAAMHYTAMQAVAFYPASMIYSTGLTVRVGALGETAVAAVTGFVLLTAVLSAALDKRRFQTLHEAHQQLEASQLELLKTQEQLRAANALLSELSIRDGLTGLYNRRHFDAVLDTEWRRARRSGGPISLMMVDVDCFKMLNDLYGHQRGDECLRDIARVIEAQPRRSHDLSARYGGEEFSVLLPGAGLSGAIKVAEAIRFAVRELALENPGCVAKVVTVSIGVCSRTPALGEDFDVMVREADLALYRAKQGGRDRVEVAGEVRVEV